MLLQSADCSVTLRARSKRDRRNGCYIENAKLRCNFQARVIQDYSSFSHYCVLSLYESDQYIDFFNG